MKKLRETNNLGKGLAFGALGILTGGFVFAVISYYLDSEYFILGFVLGAYIAFLFIAGYKNVTNNVFVITIVLAIVGILFTDFVWLLLIAILDFHAVVSIDFLTSALNFLVQYETYSPIDTLLLYLATIIGAASVTQKAQTKLRQQSARRYRQTTSMMAPPLQQNPVSNVSEENNLN